MTTELPPPSGPPLVPPVTATPPQPTGAVPSPLMAPPSLATTGQPGHPGQPGQPGQLVPVPGGRNGLAIAALCCGLAAFVPLVGVLAVVFGVVALNQLRGGFRRGRGMAITGIVLGALGVLGWAALLAIGIFAGGPERDASGQVAPAQSVFLQDLKAGDCFDGVPATPDAAVDAVTSRACSGAHEAQVAAIVELREGAFPGDKQAADLAGKACSDAVEPRLRDNVTDADLSFVYPDTALAWRLDRHAVCILAATSGKLTGSVLK